MTHTKKALALLTALAVLSAPSLACIHLPRDYAGSAEQTAQEAIVFWKDGRELLVLKNDFRIAPGDGGQLPGHLAWVVPVPTEPDGYAVEDVGLFREMFAAWEEAQPKQRGDSKNGIEPNEDRQALELLKAAKVGEYEIQPIRARGEEGGKALNRWLVENGFAEIPAARLGWYVERSWVWLAVKVGLSRGESDLVRNGSLRPLRISFATDEIVYPLLFSAGQGSFDVHLYVVADREIEGVARQAAEYGFDVDGVLPMKLPGSVQAVQEKAAREGAWKPIDAPVVHKLSGRRLEAGSRPMSSWTQDFRITVR